MAWAMDSQIVENLAFSYVKTVTEFIIQFHDFESIPCPQDELKMTGRKILAKWLDTELAADTLPDPLPGTRSLTTWLVVD